MSEYYYRVDGHELGPVSLETLQREIAFGQLVGNDSIRHIDETDWTAVADLDFQRLAVCHPRSESGYAHQTTDGNNIETQSPISVCEEPAIKLFAGDELAPGGVAGSVSEALTATAMILKTESSANQATLPPSVDESNELSTKLDQIAADKLWYARTGQVVRGPMDFQKLSSLATSGYILPNDRVRQEGENDWTTAWTITGLFPAKSSQAASNTAYPMATQSCFVSPTAPAALRQSVLPAPFASPAPAAPRPTVKPLIASSIHSTSTAPDSPPAVASRPGCSAEAARQSLITTAEPDQNELPSSGMPVEEDSLRLPQRATSLTKDVESKHKLRRGTFEEPQLFSRRNMAIATCLSAFTLLYCFVWAQPRLTVIDFMIPCRELEGNYLTLISKWSEKPTEEFWAVTRREVFYRLKSTVERVKKMHLKHEVREDLILAGESMMFAVKTDASDEVALRLEEAHRYITLAKREIEDVIQHGHSRKKSPKEKREKDPEKLSEESYL